MTRDILTDIGEGDILMSDGLGVGTVFFEVVWGNLLPTDDESHVYANIVIPVKYINVLKYDVETQSLVLRIRAVYHPVSTGFYFRFVTTDGERYSEIANYSTEVPLEVPAYSYAFNRFLPQPITASQMMLVNPNGEYLIKIDKVANNNFNRAYVYSANETDLEIGYSDDQAAKLLALCAAGKYYRYPITGVGATDYINSIVRHTDLSTKLSEQFEKNGMPIMSAEFDSTTGNLETTFSGEQEPGPDEGLTDVDKLDLELLKVADDEYIRRMQSIANAESDGEMFGVMSQYGHLLGLYLFTDLKTTMEWLSDTTEDGTLDCDGNVVPGESGQMVVTANVKRGSVIVFSLPPNGYEDHPSYSLTDPNTGEVTYKCLVGMDMGSRSDMMMCGIAVSDFTIKYNISNDDYADGYGIFLLGNTSDNRKNLLGMVVDEVTGRLLGVITSSSNIVDAVLDIKTNNLLVIKS